MKISTIIDGNVISGTILLDQIESKTIILKHKHIDAGAVKYIELSSSVINPTSNIVEFSFLNPHYFIDLYIEVDDVLHQVMETADEYKQEATNPINDYQYTEINSDRSDIEVEITEEVIREKTKEYNILSHSPYINLVEMDEMSINGHFLYNTINGLSFDLTDETKTISTEIFDLNFSTELTIAIKSKEEPLNVRLILVNPNGNESEVYLVDSYELYNSFCYSTNIISSVQEARVEIDYNSSGYKSIRIEDIFIGKSSQHFESDNKDQRELFSEEIEIHPTTSFVFTFERLPTFGLSNLINIIDENDNGYKMQFSNSRIRMVRIEDGQSSQIIMSDAVDNTKQIAIVISEVNIKMYSDGNKVKEVPFNPILNVGTYISEIGGQLNEPDIDSNVELSVVVSNKNPFDD